MYKDGGQCPFCAQDSLQKNVITETFDYKGKSFDYPNYVIYECQNCKEAVVDKKSLKESGRAIRDFYRKVDGLLVASEIQRIRKDRLCLTQDETSVLLGGGAKSFARYENSEVIQSVALDNLLRILDINPMMLTVIKEKHKPRRESILLRINSKYDVSDPPRMVANYG